METVLMIVTVIALALAIAMAVLAWRLLRENRQRSAARSEALQALASTESDERFTAIDDGIDLERDEEEEAARHETTDWDWALAERRPEARGPRIAHQPVRRAPLPDAMFSASTAPPRAPRKRWLALCAVGLAMAALGSAVYTFYGPVIAAESPLAALTSEAPGPGPRPLELLSLRHSADPGGTFTVTGLVQNPSESATIRNVMAVVYLFDRDGKYFASGKATLDFNVLQRGAESPFTVRVPNVTQVTRYRVGFRSELDGVVAHVDRRGQAPDGMTAEDR